MSKMSFILHVALGRFNIPPTPLERAFASRCVTARAVFSSCRVSCIRAEDTAGTYSAAQGEMNSGCTVL